MKFPPAFLDEIRARVPVSEVAGARVKLRKRGREWAGLSPFNAEKTPSFFVNDQKGFFHDFSSGKHGDIFTFLIETEGLSFPDAVERLAARRRRADAAPERRGRRAGGEAREPPRGAGDGRARIRGEPATADRRQGARLSVRPRPRGRGAKALFARLLQFRALRPARRAGEPGRRRRSDDRGGAAGARRGDRRPLRPVPRPGDVSDPRSLGQGGRLRRAGDGSGRQGQISQLARNPALPQRRIAVQSSPGAKIGA